MTYDLPNELILLRHGESAGNVAGKASHLGDHSYFTPQFKIGCPHDWQLSEEGEDQAKRSGEWMKQNNLDDFDLNLHSKLFRAKQTAEIVTQGLVRFQQTHLLNERANGLSATLPYPERANEFKLRGKEPYFWTPPGGESICYLVQKQKLLLENLWVFSKKAQRTLMVGHNYQMWAMRILLESLSPEEYRVIYHSGNNENQHHNCQLVHYRDVQNGKYRQRRSVCSYDPNKFDSGWVRINQP